MRRNKIIFKINFVMLKQSSNAESLNQIDVYLINDTKRRNWSTEVWEMF